MSIHSQERFVHRLRRAEAVWKAETALCFLLRAAVWLAAVPAACFLADAVFHFPAGVRLALDFALLTAILAILGVAGHLAWGRVHPLERTARRLESRDRALGSRLINALQLREQASEDGRSERTKQLAALAVEGCLRDLEDANFDQIMRSGAPWQACKRTAARLGIALAVMAAMYPVTWTGLLRYAMPLGGHPPFSFTRLVIAEPDVDGFEVVYGEPLRVVANHRGHRPNEVFLDYHPKGKPAAQATLSMFNRGGDRGYVQQIDEVTEDLVLVARNESGRAVSPPRQVRVQRTPRLEEAAVTLTLPSYTRVEPEKQRFSLQDLRALTGSTLTFELRSNRPLTGGEIRRVKDGEVAQTIPLQPAGDPRVVTGALPVNAGGTLHFTLEDVDGNLSDEEWKCGLTVLRDLPPSLSIEPNRDTFLAITHPMAITVSAADDYGVAQFRLHRALNGHYSAPLPLAPEEVPRRATREIRYLMDELGARPGDVAAFFVEAIDTAPEPNLVRSKTVHVTLISEEEYNDYLRQQRDWTDMEQKYTQLLDESNVLAERQRALAEQLAELAQQLENAATPEEHAAVEERMAALQSEQQALNESVNALAQRMENFVREQPVYDLEKEFEEFLQSRAQALRESAQQNEQARERAAGMDPAAGLQAMQQAAREQAETLQPEAPPEEEQEMRETLADLAALHEIMKDLRLFEMLTQEQQSLASQIKAYADRRDLSREDLLAMREMAERQQAAGAHLHALQQKLREDAANAQEHFPKAAESANRLAGAMQDARLEPLAQLSAESMLSGNGAQSWRRADRLRQELEALCQQCEGAPGQMQAELDSYLRPRMMSGGQTFQQMMQSRRFRMGSMGMFAQGRQGQGGYMMAGQPMDVMGGEGDVMSSLQGDGAESERPAPATQDADAEYVLDEADTLDRIEAANPESAAIRTELVLEEYRELVDQYFESITRRKEKDENN